MAQVELNAMKWAEEQFGACDLGDARRTRRAIRLAAQVAADPDARLVRIPLSTVDNHRTGFERACRLALSHSRLREVGHLKT